jgi:hypothetical protein
MKRLHGFLVATVALGFFLLTTDLASAKAPPKPPPPEAVDDVLHSWDRILPADDRFVLVMGRAAVLDNETGLVWEQSPTAEITFWFGAQERCNHLITGNRLGWRLPTLQELASLVDPTVSPGPTLPRGNPFSDVQSAFYWSATTNARDTSNAWVVNFHDGTVFGGGTKQEGITLNVWCVRGGQGVDPQ